VNNIKEEINRVKEGDISSLVDLVFEKEQQIYNIAYSYLKKEDVILDIVHDSILKAFSEINKLKNSEYFYTWFTRILINKCNEYHRKNKKIISLDEYKSPNDLHTSDEDNIDLKSAVGRLKAEFRDVVILRYKFDYTVKDISLILGCPEGTVKSRLFYAIKQLKTYIKD